MSRVELRLIVAAAAPAIAGTLIVLAIAGAEALGLTPLAVVPANVAEAAAMGNAAETLRLLQAGHDPTLVYAMSPELISSEVTRATALEAAIWSRQVELVALFDRRGTIVGPAARTELACLARDLGVDDVVEYLDANSESNCQPGAARARVVARSKDPASR